MTKRRKKVRPLVERKSCYDLCHYNGRIAEEIANFLAMDQRRPTGASTREISSHIRLQRDATLSHLRELKRLGIVYESGYGVGGICWQLG